MAAVMYLGSQSRAMTLDPIFHLPTDKEVLAAKLSEVMAECVRLQMLGVEANMDVSSFFVRFLINAPVRSLPVLRYPLFSEAPRAANPFKCFGADIESYEFFEGTIWLDDPSIELDYKAPDLWLSKLGEVSKNIDCFITKHLPTPQTPDLFHQAGA